MRVDKLPALGWLEGRYPRSGALGDTGLVFTHTPGSTNTASQSIKSLTPGSVYALRMMSANFASMGTQAATGLNISFNDVASLDDQNFDFPIGNCYSHKHGPYQEADQAWMTYHWRLFRAESKTATLTISDHAAAAGQQTIFNWVSVSPYFEKEDAQQKD